MGTIRLIIVFASMLITGYAMLSIICNNQKRSFFESIALIMTLGAGTLGILLFWLALTGIKPSFNLMFGFLVISAIISVIMVYKKKNAEFALPNKLEKNEIPLLTIAFFIWVALFSIVIINSAMLSMFDVDAYRLWGLKSKTLFYEGLKDGGLFTKLSLSYSQLNYPLMVPFLMSSLFSSDFASHDITSQLIFPFIYIALTFTIYATLRWRLKRKPAILLSLLFISMPALIRWSGAGFADVPLTLFYAASIHYLVKYLKEQNKADFILALLFTLFTSFCKNEGLAISVINITVFIIFNSFFPFKKEKIIQSVYFAVTLFVLMLPWLIWSRGIPHPYENYTQRLLYFLNSENRKRILEITQIFIKSAFGFDAFLRWGIIWIILPVAAILNYRKFKEKYVIAMWILFVMHIAAYFAVFIISPWSPDFLAEMALERITLHITPALIYLIAYHLSDK